MNSGPLDPSTFAALSMLPVLFVLVWAVVSLVALVLMVVIIVLLIRFVKAHERIAKHLETLAAPRPDEPADGRIEKVIQTASPGSRS
jgi:hypothetical protein